jgi:hypothetical protein
MISMTAMIATIHSTLKLNNSGLRLTSHATSRQLSLPLSAGWVSISSIPSSTPAAKNNRICTLQQNPIYVFLFWELRGLNLHFHIHVSVSDLYITRIGPHISCSKIGRSIMGIYKSLTSTFTCTSNSFSGNICFEFSVLVLLSVHFYTE